MFGFDPVAVVTGAKLLVDGTDARRLVNGALLLQGKVQRHVQEWVAFRRLRAAILYLNIVRCLRDSVRIRDGLDNTQSFLLQAVQLERCEPVLPDVGKKSADIVGVYVIHDGCDLILGYVII